MILSLFQFNRGTDSLCEVDIHSHLIPGIDDGAKNMERSIELILRLKALGYRKLITTPHISDMFPNTKAKIVAGFESLKQELISRDIDIEIEVAAEYYVDECFEKVLEREELLSFGGEKRYLLIEFSYFTPLSNLENIIYEIQLKGYTPVLAHPERYTYWHHRFEKYQELKEMGVLLQININSINGYYNKAVQQIAEKLIKSSMVHFVGSDTHHRNHIKSLKSSFCLPLYKKMFQKNNILNDLL